MGCLLGSRGFPKSAIFDVDPWGKCSSVHHAREFQCVRTQGRVRREVRRQSSTSSSTSQVVSGCVQLSSSGESGLSSWSQSSLIIKWIIIMRCILPWTNGTQCKIEAFRRRNFSMIKQNYIIQYNVQYWQHLFQKKKRNIPRKTLPKAQPTRGLSSHHKFTVRKSWSNYNFRIFIAH